MILNYVLLKLEIGKLLLVTIPHIAKKCISKNLKLVVLLKEDKLWKVVLK
jgi:hypothetical protein